MNSSKYINCNRTSENIGVWCFAQYCLVRDDNLLCLVVVGGTTACIVHCDVELSRRADLTCCQVYDEKEGEAEAGERAGRAGGRHTFHEVGDVHVGNRTQVDLPTPRGTVGGVVHSCSRDMLHVTLLTVTRRGHVTIC